MMISIPLPHSAISSAVLCHIRLFMCLQPSTATSTTSARSPASFHFNITLSLFMFILHSVIQHLFPVHPPLIVPAHICSVLVIPSPLCHSQCYYDPCTSVLSICSIILPNPSSIIYVVPICVQLRLLHPVLTKPALSLLRRLHYKVVNCACSLP
jgi:hypothetical protein